MARRIAAEPAVQPVNHDDVATAFAAVWDPAIIGFTASACDVSQLAEAEF